MLLLVPGLIQGPPVPVPPSPSPAFTPASSSVSIPSGWWFLPDSLSDLMTHHWLEFRTIWLVWN